MLDFIAERIRIFRAESETKFEKHWVEKLLKLEAIDDIPSNYHHSLPYQLFIQQEFAIVCQKLPSNYHHSLPYQLHIQQEFEIIRQYSACKRKRILFIGSGALPYSAIHYSRNFHLTVECIDVDSEAIELSQRLVDKLQIPQFFQFHNVDVLSFFNFKEFDFIIVAALAGIRKSEKKRIIQHIANNIDKNIPVVFRTVLGIKKLWLPYIEKKDLNKFSICDEYRNISSCFVDSIFITMV